MKVIDVRECKVESILSMRNGIQLKGWGFLKMRFSELVMLMFQTHYNGIRKYNRCCNIISESFVEI